MAASIFLTPKSNTRSIEVPALQGRTAAASRSEDIGPTECDLKQKIEQDHPTKPELMEFK